jgi:hypothetical protein
MIPAAPSVNIVLFFSSLKVGLHYGDYRSKPFEDQKNIFYILKTALA